MILHTRYLPFHILGWLALNHPVYCETEYNDDRMIPRSRPNWGVVFSPLYEVNNMGGTWKIMWQVTEVPGKVYDQATSPSCNSKFSCSIVSNVSRITGPLSVKLTQSLHLVDSWVKRPELFTILKKTGIREKRGIFNFVGAFEKALFGVATEDDIGSLSSGVEALKKLENLNVGEIKRLGSSLTSVINNSGKQMRTIADDLKSVHSSIMSMDNSVRELQNSSVSLQESLIALSENCNNHAVYSSSIVASEVVLLLVQVYDYIQSEQRLESLTTAMTGVITPTLISPESMVKGLSNAEEIIRSEFPDGRLRYSTHELGFYYSSKISTLMVVNNTLYVSMDVPIDFSSEYLYVYEVMTYPTPLDWRLQVNSQQPQHGMSQLINIPTKFIISTSGNGYFYGEDNVLAGCKGEGVRICPQQFPMLSTKIRSCILELWDNRPTPHIIEVCDWGWVTHDKSSFVLVYGITPGRWYVIAPPDDDDPWKMSCRNRVAQDVPRIISGVVSINCDCSLVNKYFTIPGRLSRCDSSHLPISYQYIQNPFDVHPNDLSINPFLGTDLTLYPIKTNFSIPLTFDATWGDDERIIKKQALDLKKIWYDAQQSASQYKNASMPLLQRIAQLKYVPGSTTLTFYLACAGVILGGSSFLCHLICLIGAFQRSHAAPISDTILQDEEFAAQLLEVLVVLSIVNTILLVIATMPSIVGVYSVIRKRFTKPKYIYAHDYKQGKGTLKVALIGQLSILESGFPKPSTKFITILVTRMEADEFFIPSPIGSHQVLFTHQVGSILGDIHPEVLMRRNDGCFHSCTRFTFSEHDLRTMFLIPDGVVLAGLVNVQVIIN